MDNDGASGEREKELSITLAASSMISASDMVTREAYQANLKRIQEVKEMVQRLEINNETAHRNFLVNQLEKRAKDGREAEVMLAQLRNQPELPETVQFTNNFPSDKSEVILPTTATLVEVPESHSASHPSLAQSTMSPSQTLQDRPAGYRWIPHPQVPQVQPYYPFRYYVPPSADRRAPQSTAASGSQASIDRQKGWYSTQNVPSQSRVHNPLAHQSGLQSMQGQQSSQSWSSYSHPVVSLPASDIIPASDYHPSQQGWVRTAPGHNSPSTGSSSLTYHEPRPSFPTQPTTSRPPVTTLQNLPLPTATSRVQAALSGVPASADKSFSGQLAPTRPFSRPAKPQSRPVSTAVSVPVTISELQRPKPPQQPLQHQQHQQFQLHAQQPSLQPGHSQPPKRCTQPPLQLQQHTQQSQEFPSQRPLQSFQTHLLAPPRLGNRVPSTSAPEPNTSQSQSQPSQTQSPHTIVTQEQARQCGAKPRADQATFIKHFQAAVQRGTLPLKVLFLQAKTSGISDDWLNAAINSLPRDVWESAVAQVNQSGHIIDVQSSANVPQQQASTIRRPDVPVVSTPPTPTSITTPLVQATPPTQQVAKPSPSTEGRISLSAPGQISGSYAVQLQYYAEQATQSALSAEVARISTKPPGNIPPTQKTAATPTRSMLQTQVNVKTPKDANKSTLARDILRSLGKIVPKLGEPADKDYDRLPGINTAQPVSPMSCPNPPVAPPTTSFASSSSIPSETPNVQNDLQQVAHPNLSTPRSVSKMEGGEATLIEGPIMIDLTLEDSDESVDEKGQEPEPAFPVQTAASATTLSQPVSPTNTTNHTPLLKNLSLEEPPVDIATEGNNANVRMYSPPLPSATEGNMESALLYPSLDSAEPLSPRFELLPREASEHPPDSQLPLFLPSPPVSPAHTGPPETDLEMISDETKSQPFLKRRPVDVDEMKMDTELTPPRVRKRRKQQVHVLIPPAPPYVKEAIKRMKELAMERDTNSDSEGVGKDEEFQYSHLEQLLIEESKSRLLERQCRWLNCGAILNCASNLLVHLRSHAREEDSQAPFLCRWASCQRQFSAEEERDVHLERHTIRPLPCPFTGCEEQFNKPVEVMQHEVQHQKAERREPLMRKPTCQPIVPAIPARLGPPPHRLPSHRVIPRRIVKCRISADRHATVGPWILWNIFSPVDLNSRKQNASMRGRPTRQAIDYDVDSSDSRRDDYDFLLALSSYPTKNPRLDDLDSTLITMSAARGLTLWGSGSTVNSVAGSATPEEYKRMDATVTATEGTKVDVGSHERANSGRTEQRESGQPVIGEEDAVERMLIL